MKTVQYVVFRYLTHTDFFNIYKPSRTETGGGGQSYIDFGIGSVSLDNWQMFFTGVPSVMRTRGPSWTFEVNSIGLSATQQLTIYQRRAQSFVVAGQRITSNQSNRVLAWDPQNGFPQPVDPTNRTSRPPKLAVYIVRTDDGEFWAGWFQNSSPCRDQAAFDLLQSMLPGAPVEGHASFIAPTTTLYIDESDSATPFLTLPVQATIFPGQEVSAVETPPVQPEPPTTASTEPELPKTPKIHLQRKVRSEEEITKSLFEEDENYTSEPEKELKEVVIKIWSRNAKAIKGLKELYQGKCQITGEKYTFLKKDGTPYCEAHHLIPLGNEGADSPYNIIIVNPLIHRMLHYANVSEIDLTAISADNTIDFLINGETHTIKWHPKHADFVKGHQEADST